MRFIFILTAAFLILSNLSQAEQPPSSKDNTAQLQAAKAAIMKKEYEAGFKLLLPLAEYGNASAQYHVGQMYQFGYGTKHDNKEAFNWCRKAAEQGEVNAQTDLGAIYQSGWSGIAPKDYAEALKWLRKAADQGYAPAQAMVGNTYAKGLGVMQDDVESLSWYRKSANQGYAAVIRPL